MNSEVDKVKLNLGCGEKFVSGWHNVDYALGARLFKFPFMKEINNKLHIFNMEWNSKIEIHDLRKKFPWDSNSIDVIYCSHVLEHFTKTEGEKFLKRCYMILKKGGIIRIIVPDLSVIVSKYVSGNIKADEFLDKLGVLRNSYSTLIKNVLSPLVSYPHQCMYDKQSLKKIMKKTGFSFSFKLPFESMIEDVHNIELADRVNQALIVEGTK